MKLFDSTTAKSNFLVFIFFLVLTVIAVTFSSCNDDVKPIIVRDSAFFDSTSLFNPHLPDESKTNHFLPDSVYLKNIQYIDSMKKIIK